MYQFGIKYIRRVDMPGKKLSEEIIKRKRLHLPENESIHLLRKCVFITVNI